MIAIAIPDGGTVAQADLSLHRPDEWPEVLSVSQVSQLLAIGRAAVIAAIERGELSAIAIGGQYRIAAESVWRLVPEEIRTNWPDGRWRTQDPSPE
jgi:excisionase family DNA binding protein